MVRRILSLGNNTVNQVVPGLTMQSLQGRYDPRRKEDLSIVVIHKRQLYHEAAVACFAAALAALAACSS
jgi:hypothetical protein